MISIHPPRAGRDFLSHLLLNQHIRFQSTRPVRGGTMVKPSLPSGRIISIHPPRAGRDLAALILPVNSDISIHPPRAGRDFDNLELREITDEISIHPPRAGRDHICD